MKYYIGLLALCFCFGCKAKRSEYERGWYNALDYVVWKNNHRAELPCVLLKEFGEDNPGVRFTDSLFENFPIPCGSGNKRNGWTTDTLRIHDTVYMKARSLYINHINTLNQR